MVFLCDRAPAQVFEEQRTGRTNPYRDRPSGASELSVSRAAQLGAEKEGAVCCVCVVCGCLCAPFKAVLSIRRILSDNKLFGPIPTSLGNATMLTRMCVSVWCGACVCICIFSFHSSPHRCMCIVKLIMHIHNTSSHLTFIIHTLFYTQNKLEPIADAFRKRFRSGVWVCLYAIHRRIASSFTLHKNSTKNTWLLTCQTNNKLSQCMYQVFAGQ